MGRWNSLYQLVSCSRAVRKKPAALVPSTPESLWHLKLLSPWKALRTHPSNPAQGINHIDAFFLMWKWVLCFTQEPKTSMLFFQVSSLACKSVFHKHSRRNSFQDRSWGMSTCIRGSVVYKVFQAPLVVLQNRDLFLSWFHLDRDYLRSTKTMGHTLCKR